MNMNTFMFMAMDRDRDKDRDRYRYRDRDKVHGLGREKVFTKKNDRYKLWQQEARMLSLPVIVSVFITLLNLSVCSEEKLLSG